MVGTWGSVTFGPIETPAMNARKNAHLLWSVPMVLAAFIVVKPTFGQTACDSVQILELEYGPFTDTALIVVAQNTADQFLSVPLFSLRNEAGDTLTQEIFTSFALGEVPQTHVMPLLPGESLPASPFLGSIALSYNTMEGAVTCIFPYNGDLCPTETCIPLRVFVYRFGPDDPVTTSFLWNVTNNDGDTLSNGTFTLLAGGQQQDDAELCLPPGNYALHIDQNGNEGIQFAYGVSLDDYSVEGPIDELPAGGQAVLPFSYYPACVSVTNGILEEPKEELLISIHGSLMQVRDGTGDPLERITITDMSGRILWIDDPNSSEVIIDLSRFSPGLYLLHHNRMQQAQRFFIP